MRSCKDRDFGSLEHEMGEVKGKQERKTRRTETIDEKKECYGWMDGLKGVRHAKWGLSQQESGRPERERERRRDGWEKRERVQ